MSQTTRRALLAVGAAATLLAATNAMHTPARAAELYAPETLDRSRTSTDTVYSTGNRRAAHMILLVESLDGSGKTVTTTTWVRDVPPNNRAYFEVAVPTAAAYRVSVQSFDWVEDHLDRRKAW